MRARSCVVVLVGLLPVIACSSFGEDEGQSNPSTTNPTPADDPKKDAPPPPVDTPPPSELTEKYGHFVAEKGNDDSGDGSRAKPFKTIGKGLEKAKVDGKRVYVCAGKYIEALTLEDGVSMIGGYDCSQPEWSNSAKKSRVESPTSPAIRAKDIKTLTRFENFDVLAPDAVDPSGSSIGLIAEGSDKLTIVSSRIAAGSGAAGKAGIEGIQLLQTGNVDGVAGADEGEYCRSPAGCAPPLVAPNPAAGPSGGTSVCSGVAGLNGGNGGKGGSGGMYLSSYNNLLQEWRWNAASFTSAAQPGESKSGAAGANGEPGAPTAALGQLSPDGYAPADGLPGTNGAPGEGGAGGNGAGPPIASAMANGNEYWHARAGGSGGAGGCPGIAGTPGKGGGASIAILSFSSPITLEKSEIVSDAGGAGGRGTFGSRSTLGGAGGSGAGNSGSPGGAGGLSGVSGSGAGGPSIAVVHSGVAPKLVGTTLKPGLGGKGGQEETSADGKVLPASPNGESREMLSL